ncbi:hypothetical protein [Mucilaginibacter ginsenosidivorans]|uniref:Uncharacterized protein n=2 Tax=Mucilaginibacter ginsenosidivorans TaxID=398053 RepID=A0A5B8UVU7_9SPHI|nr:hypothetical protein [Mucilaginibacter ginsenosidivorans]QEC63194.1 hypothetical protein FRZ54_11595 [Mucilaginibacter ginsenosidivorans]
MDHRLWSKDKKPRMKPGDKVICIDASIDPEKAEEIRRDFEIWITKDKEYTIREILENNGIVPGVLLDEVHNFPKYFKLIDRMQEPAFAIWRFRKLNYAIGSAEEVKEAELVEVGKKEITLPDKLSS